MGHNLPVTIILLATVVGIVGLMGAWSFGVPGGIAGAIIGLGIAFGVFVLIHSGSDEPPFDPA